MRCAVLVLACLLAPAICRADGIRVQVGKTARVPVAGATAAFSLNAVYAEASAQDGIVLVTGRQAGSTNIVVVTVVGTQTFEIVVVDPPPFYPPGFQAAALTGAESKYATYEFRYSSIPSQQQNVVDVSEREGDRLFRLHVANANLLGGPEAGYSSIRFPSVFYEVKTARREVTFLDQYVVATPLTVENGLVRGVHVREGPWSFHAGYSSLSAFQNLFLPTDREAVLGATYEHPLNPQSRLAANFYAFPSGHRAVSGIRGGIVGSVFYQYKRANDLTVLAEAGVSREPGLAFRVEKIKGKSQYRNNVRYKGPDFAGLSTDGNRGLLADGTWNRPLVARFEVRANYYANRYLLPRFRQTNAGGNGTLRYDVSRHWSFTAGASYAHLKPETPPGTGVESKSLPLGVDFKSKFLSASYQHAFIRNEGQDLGGRQDRVSAGTGWASWRLNAFWDRQTQAPTADFILTETPGLREVMDRLGLIATSPEQIAQLIQQDAVLLQLGYLKDVRLNLAPLRTQVGANAVWAGHGQAAPQLTVSYLRSDNQLVLGRTTSDIGTVSFACRLPARLDLIASWSLYNTSAPGAPAQRRTLLDFSVRRRFSSVPDWLFPNRGTVSGRVFEDDQQRGEWRPGATPFENVLVTLDGSQQARTDAEGRFEFKRVPPGEHQVEVLFDSGRPFYLTTPSPRRVPANSHTDFGIAYATSLLVGFVVNDGGTGIEKVQVTVSGNGRTWQTTTDDEGKFSLDGLVPGSYDALPNVDSFPPGYALADVVAQGAQVLPDAPGRMQFTVRASRAIAGTVSMYDRTLTKQVPIEGITVKLRELDRQTTTGKDGAYIFRDLPAGQFTIVASFDGQDFVRTERLPAQPTFVRDANINVVSRDRVP